MMLFAASDLFVPPSRRDSRNPPCRTRFRPRAEMQADFYKVQIAS